MVKDDGLPSLLFDRARDGLVIVNLSRGCFRVPKYVTPYFQAMYQGGFLWPYRIAGTVAALDPNELVLVIDEEPDWVPSDITKTLEEFDEGRQGPN